LFQKVAARILSGWWESYAVGLFSLGVPFIYLSSLVKQYSTDIAASIVILLASIEVCRRGVTARRALLLGGLGAVVVWFSQPAIFVLAGIGSALLIRVWETRDGASARLLVRTWALWACSAVAAATLAVHNVTASDRAFFQWIWAEGFMPFPPANVWDVAWVLRKLTWAFGTFGSGMGQMHGGLEYRWSFMFTIAMIVGAWALWNSRRDVSLFLLLPIVVTALASAPKIYPLTARLFAFLLPSVLLVTAAGASHLYSKTPARASVLALASLAILVGAPVYAAANNFPPFWLQHVRPVIEQVFAERAPADGVYVYYSGGQAFRYYARHFELPNEGILLGRCHGANPREYLRELDRFRGKRVWVIVTSEWRNGTDESLMLEYLDRIGRRLKTIARPGSRPFVVEAANAYLYDLSDADRLGSATSATFPIAPHRMVNPSRPWLCYGVSQAEPKG
jgi:hypothetical protein